MSLPDEYLAALERLGEAFAAYESNTGSIAVLVGGAAAALYTEGAFMSADFDVVAVNDEEFARSMADVGFLADSKAGHGLIGWYHPSQPQFAVEQVSGGYFDGRGELGRCFKIAVRDGSEIVLPAIEDLIADRLGQHEVSGGDTAMLEQAKALFSIAGSLDNNYLIRRIEEESGNPALLGLYGAT